MGDGRLTGLAVSVRTKLNHGPEEEEMTKMTPAAEHAMERLAGGLLDCIAQMVEARIEWAADHGVEVSEEAAVKHALDSLIKMIGEKERP
jgi:hypothetical protein